MIGERLPRLLLIGYSTEGTFAHFSKHVAASTAPHDVIDLARLRDGADLTITDAPDELVISIDDDVWNLSEFSAIYARIYFFELGAPPRNRALSALITSLMGFLEHTPARVANRPSAGASNVNKMAHLGYLKDAGLKVPETHVLGDAALARTIVRPDGSWISKSVSSVRTRAVAVDEALYDRLDKLSMCASMFQRRIRGADVRVHCVAGQCIAEKIVSQQVDYRYKDPTGARPEFSPIDTPDAIARACAAYCERQRLVIAGIDFKISEVDGEWYALEANPMPGYDSYDRRLGGRISRALLAALTPDEVTDDEPFVTAARRPLSSPF